ncbi:hypothetical protein NG819_20660 [Pseudarthrobacter sp. Fe7]|nr:hypothetical protein NG819_20660 [Pseudarthrobacter sp. Fe7]
MPAVQVDGAARHQAVEAGQVLDFEVAGAGTKASGEIHGCCPAVHVMQPA